jgi:hypothetical protein
MDQKPRLSESYNTVDINQLILEKHEQLQNLEQLV